MKSLWVALTLVLFLAACSTAVLSPTVMPAPTATPTLPWSVRTADTMMQRNPRLSWNYESGLILKAIPKTGLLYHGWEETKKEAGRLRDRSIASFLE